MIPTSFGSFKSSNLIDSFLKRNFFVKSVLLFFLCLFLNQLFNDSINAQWGGTPLDLSGRVDLLPGLGTGIGGQFTDADLGAMEAYYVGGGYMTAEQFQAAAAAYVEANVDPQFEGSLEDFTVFLGDYVGVADLPRYEPTVPEYPADSSSPPSAENIPANPVAPAAGDQPTAVEGGALPAETPLAGETAAENSSVVQGNVSDGGVPVITGEDPTVAAALVSLEDGENNTTQPEVVFLGNQTQPETVQLGNQTQPETVQRV